MVDDCCGSGHVHEFDAFIPPVQARATIPESTYDISAFEIPGQDDLLQPIGAGRPDKECGSTYHGGCCAVL